jgi:UDP-N-acetylmuramoylalanine--D-glutamate ligase
MKNDQHVKQALVLGLGASGEAAARLLLRQGCGVTVADAAAGAALEAKALVLRDAGCRVCTGSRELPPGDFGLAVVSPGIPIDDAWIVSLKSRGIPVISELELGWRFRRSRILAVTGSNGKSTLVKLCREAIEQNGFTAVAGGNYGVPLSAIACSEPAPDWVVVEVSSFQLEAVDRFAPDAGILLNLNPNHLDRHGTLDVYTHMKARLFARMTGGQAAVIPEVAPPTVRAAIPAGGRIATFGLSPAASFRYERGFIAGPGLDHPVSVEGTIFDNEVMGLTAAACVAALVGAGLSPDGVTAAARGFERLPHRMQTVMSIRGVTFVNDSKATNLAALAAGLGMAKGPVRLIAGGLLKERDLDSVKKILAKRVRGVYIIGKYSQVMADAWTDAVACVICADLREAVGRAWKDAEPGEVVLLSPGCASFDQFKSFEDRGEQFSEIVREIEKGEM